MTIDWRSIRPLNGARAEGFEELCAQLARSEAPEGSGFVRKGAPDAGVECYATLEDRTEWAWQAKYFHALGTSQWSQIDNSVRTALEKHPRMTRYIVCCPLDLADARSGTRVSARDRWDRYVAKWEDLAARLGMAVEFTYWGSHELLERLTNSEHSGRVRFWFGGPVMDADWFARRVDEAVETAGARYTPELHINLPIAAEFEAFGRTESLTQLSLREFHYADTDLCIPTEASFRAWLDGIASRKGTGTGCSALSEREILQALFEATGGAAWHRSENWVTDAPLGRWYGVEVDGLGQVSRLRLRENNLTGILPPEIGGLSNLRGLILDGNELVGPIPPELGELSDLVHLDLGSNELAGLIPPEWGELSTLVELLLDNNALAGPISDEFAGLTRLHELSLTGNAALAGTLPANLVALRHLEVLMAGGTSLCAPSDPGFQAWLRGIGTSWVGPCGDSDESMAYLTQAVQSREFPVSLVAGENALLRVFLTARHTTNVGIPAVRARFYLNGREVHMVDIRGKSTSIPTKVDESSLTESANAEIPGDVVQPGLEMVIEVNPDGTLDSALGVPKRIPETGRLAVNVRSMPLFDLTLIPFLWTENPDSAILYLTNGMSAEPTGHRLLWPTHTLLPVGALRVTAHEAVSTDTNNRLELLRITGAIRAMEGGTGHYMGMLSRDGGRGGGGYAARGGRVAFAGPDAADIAHELGHNFDLGHAPCGPNLTGIDRSFPYTDGSSGAWGYDPRSGGSLVSPAWGDLMSYCDPKWISDYSFTNALRFRLNDEAATQADSDSVPAKALLLWGGVNADATPFLEPTFVVEAPAELPDSAGEYRITGRSDNGAELFSLSFAMPETAHSGGSSSFAFVLPVRPGWEGTLASITLSGPGGSARLDGDTDLPMAILRNPRTRQIRGIISNPPLETQAAADAGAALAPGLEVLLSRGIPDTAAWRR